MQEQKIAFKRLPQESNCARSFVTGEGVYLISEERLSAAFLIESIFHVLGDRDRYSSALARFPVQDGTQAVCDLIAEVACKKSP